MLPCVLSIFLRSIFCGRGRAALGGYLQSLAYLYASVVFLHAVGSLNGCYGGAVFACYTVECVTLFHLVGSGVSGLGALGVFFWLCRSSFGLGGLGLGVGFGFC